MKMTQSNVTNTSDVSEVGIVLSGVEPAVSDQTVPEVVRETPVRALVSDNFLDDYKDEPVVPGEVNTFNPSTDDIGFTGERPLLTEYDWNAYIYGKLQEELSIDSDTSYTTFNGGRVYGVRLNKTLNLKGSSFLTKNNNSLQLNKPSLSSIKRVKEYEEVNVEVLIEKGWVPMAPTIFGLSRTTITTVPLKG